MKIPLVICLMLLGASGLAQEQIRLQFLSLQTEGIEGVYWSRDGEMTPLRVPHAFFSRPLRVSAGSDLPLYRRAEGEEGWREAARLELPRGEREALVLLQSRGNGLAAVVVPLRERDFPQGSYLVVNRTGQDLALVLDGQAERFAANTSRVVRPERQRQAPIPVLLRLADDPDNNTLVTTTWFHDPDNRELVFLSLQPEGLLVRTVTRHPAPPDSSGE